MTFQNSRKKTAHMGGLPLVRKAVLFKNSISTNDHVRTITEQNKTAMNSMNYYYCLTMPLMHNIIWTIQ